MFTSIYARLFDTFIGKVLSLFKLISGVGLVCCLIVIFCIVERRDNFFNSLPFTSIEDSSDIVVDNSGVMLLSETSGMKIHEDFILTDDIKLNELANWLDNRYSSVDIFVNQKVVYKNDIEVLLDSFKVRKIFFKYKLKSKFKLKNVSNNDTRTLRADFILKILIQLFESDRLIRDIAGYDIRFQIDIRVILRV